MTRYFRSASDVLAESLEGQKVSGLARAVIELARPYYRALVPVVALQLAAALLEALSATLVVPLVQVLIDSGAGSVPLAMGAIGKWGSWVLGAGPIEAQLRRLAVAFLSVGLARAAANYASDIATNRFALKVSADLRQRLLALYLGAEYQFFLDRHQGRMVNDLTQEPGTAAFAITLYLDWGRQLLFAVALTAVLLGISWQATLVASAIGVGIAIALGRLRLAAAVNSKESLVNKRRLAALVAEVLSGIRQIKLFGAEKSAVRSHDGLVRETISLNLRNLRLVLLPGIVSQLAGVLFLGGALFGLTFLPPGGAKALLAALGAFMVVSARLLPVVSSLSTQRIRLFSHVATLEFVLSALKQIPGEQALRQRVGARPFPGLRDRIEFEGVTFAYKRSSLADTMPARDSWLARRFESSPYATADGTGTPPTVLRDVTISFKRGQQTALVGPSGGGKSTVVDLLVRLFDPQEGLIKVDGVDLREYEVQSWRDHIGYVSQDTFIFHGTIRDNIGFSKSDAMFEEVERAARIASAHDFIVELPEGYDTVVGDRGLKLSGGQRQRIAIARAILRDPSILILDEATSSLDTVAERAVQAGIEAASRGRTVIVIAHRLSTVIDADWIYVLDQGRVVESGSHEDLMSCHGVYRRLYASMVPG